LTSNGANAEGGGHLSQLRLAHRSRQWRREADVCLAGRRRHRVVDLTEGVNRFDHPRRWEHVERAVAVLALPWLPGHDIVGVIEHGHNDDRRHHRCDPFGDRAVIAQLGAFPKARGYPERRPRTDTHDETGRPDPATGSAFVRAVANSPGVGIVTY